MIGQTRSEPQSVSNGPRSNLHYSTCISMRIILDTDLAMGAPGSDIDDGFALALAHCDPDIQIDMITTVHGNTDVESATILTCYLADQLGIHHVPIVKGAATRLTRPELRKRPSPDVESRTSTRVLPTPGYGPAAMVEHVLAHPGEITVVAIGALTNLAIAISLEPKFAPAVKELVIMGGLFFGTMPDRTLPSEFNVWSDPEAAQCVLRSGIPQRWVGLDVTLKVRLTRAHAQELIDKGTEWGKFAGEYTLEWIDYLKKRWPGREEDLESAAMHDPLAVAVLTSPELCGWRDMNVSVIGGDGEARGVMIGDRRGNPNPPEANCKVATSVDAEAFLQHFLTLIGRL